MDGSSPLAERSRPRWRALCLMLMALLVAAVAWFLYGTESGHQLRQADVVRQWVHHQPVLAPLIFMVAYCVVGTLALPVWWLQIIAGHCFGLAMGMVWCHLGAMASVVISVPLAQWLMGQWLWQRLQPYQSKLAQFDRKLNHNGLLVVTAARVSHVMPFGITNYLLGLSRISLGSIILGTLLGGTLSKMIHVTAGVNPRMLVSPRYLAVLVGINLLLLSPLLVRYYMRPRRNELTNV